MTNGSTEVGMETIEGAAELAEIYRKADQPVYLHSAPGIGKSALAKQMLDELVKHSPEILRADAKVRAETISKADKLLKKVKQYMK